MKKIYIKPEIVLEQIETADIMETSWGYNGEGFNGDKEDIEGGLTGGSTFGDAKEAGDFVFDGFEM